VSARTARTASRSSARCFPVRTAAPERAGVLNVFVPGVFDVMMPAIVDYFD
jgi:hypothetical protein